MKNIFCLLISVFLLSQNLAFAQTPDSTNTSSPQALPDSVQIDPDDQNFPSTDSLPQLPRLFYNLGLDGNFSSGNLNRKLFGTRFTVNYENPASIVGFFTSPKFQIGSTNDQLQERELFADLNSTLFYTQSDLYGLVFGSYEQSNLRKINYRWMTGIGLGFRILGGKKYPDTRISMNISNAFLHEVTDFYTSQDKNVWRNSTRFRVKAEIVKEKLFVQNTTFFQPSLGEAYLRWNSFSQISYKLGKHVAFTLTFENTYESINVEGVSNAQTNLTFGLNYSSSN
ncbi:Protein of unknown function, DUF481 [Pseudarcicella hirudinis]|uniref:DUF481 domain-containing protein n=1 Tax=Pseudarcicella hirudinis TaxID=1079859 RepID=A0A1I5SRH6_9BACT|nr:DUF481 domain-containing protein [Pseudarcicella hirudinis]SFP73392.1 Protein of unknown function, DUF481 [Pseudarcicella hirudinis]